jgi:hypothetical protein
MPIMPSTDPIITVAPGKVEPVTIASVASQTTDPTYVGVAIDTSYNPRGSLMTYVEGANWSVEYYRQAIGPSNDLSPLQTPLQGPYQQYVLVHNLTLKVTQALVTSQDEESKSMLLSGAAIVLPGMIPNVGDEFTADAGDGRAAIFTVKSSEKKSFLKDAVYQIEYDLKNYATPELINDLNAKVVQETTFITGNMMIGLNPIVATADVTAMQKLQQIMVKLISQYFSNFFSNEYQTLLVPNQINSTYDPFVTRAIHDYITTDENPFISKIRIWNIDGDLALKSKTIWDVLNVMRYDYLPLAIQQVGVALTVRCMNRWPQFQSVYFSGIGQLVYPLDQRSDVDAQYVSFGTPVVSPMGEGRARTDDLTRLIGAVVLDGFTHMSGAPATELPDIVPVTVDEYYVFSAGFYADTPVPASALEQITLKAIQGQQIDLSKLLALAIVAPKWGNLERFYYVPVIIALIKANIGNI